jgi:two-component system, cell cycle response regulator
MRHRVIGSPSAVLRERGPLVGLWTLFALYAVWLLIGPGGPSSSGARWLYNIVVAGAAFVCFKSRLTRGKERPAWLFLGAALALWAAGDFYYTLFLADKTVVPPTVTDVLWLASYPCLFAAIALLVRARTAHLERSLWLDAVVATLAVAAIGATVLFGAVVESTGGSPRLVAMHIAYPLADVLLLGLVVAVLALSGWKFDRTWLAIVGGTAVLAVADGVYLYQAAVGSYAESTIFDAGWPLAMVLFATAAWQPSRELGTVHLEGARLLAVPAVFGVTALGLLVYGQFEPLNVPGLVLAAASILAVIARMVFTFREKMFLLARRSVEARTDALTGIGNRRKLLTDLEARLEAGKPSVLLLLDLDGFKNYNDTFGHPAGDALLARLAKKLSVAVGDRGEAYRMGGDEFCVLATVPAPDREIFALSASAAMEEQGNGFRITAAYGSVQLPEEATEVPEAMRLVDSRMYDEKDGRRASAGRQSRDVLLRVLYERDMRLQGHLSELVELVRVVGTRLQLSDDELLDLTLATELHEVGKLAIPDSILLKPGPLTEDDWEFVRRHPLIGERILQSAPALARVAKTVRSIHERLDGSGYPDGLVGDEIPLASRIINTSAALLLMTSSRPYQTARTPEEAIEELRRCAGTQFDPVVVDMVAAAYDELHPRLAVA